jgi:hypothetical protein
MRWTAVPQQLCNRRFSLGTCSCEGRRISPKRAPQPGLSAGPVQPDKGPCTALILVKWTAFHGTFETLAAANGNESRKSRELRIQRALSTRRPSAALIVSSFV